MRARRLGLSVAILMLVGLAASARGDVILDPATLLRGVAVDTAAGATDTDVSSPPALPYIDLRSAVAGESSSTNVYTFIDEFLNITFQHERAGQGGSAAISQGSIYFSVTQDTLYNLSGSYAAVDPGGRAGVDFLVSLADASVGSLFHSRQLSLDTPNESFVLGESGGDTANSNTGAANGTLLAGHQYQFSYQVTLGSGIAGAASGVGNLSLELTPTGATPEVVPVPAAAYGGAGLLGMLAIARAAWRGRMSGAPGL